MPKFSFGSFLYFERDNKIMFFAKLDTFVPSRSKKHETSHIFPQKKRIERERGDLRYARHSHVTISGKERKKERKKKRFGRLTVGDGGVPSEIFRIFRFTAGGGAKGKRERESPTNIGITRGTPLVATLVVVSHGVEMLVAPRFLYH